MRRKERKENLKEEWYLFPWPHSGESVGYSPNKQNIKCIILNYSYRSSKTESKPPKL